MNQGLKHLAIQAQKRGVIFRDSSKVVIIPFLGFIDQLITLMRKFMVTSDYHSWGAYIVEVLPDKHFSNIYGSWLKYNVTSLQSKLLSTLLPTRSVSRLNLYLKLRKLVLKTDFTTKSLDSLSLSHEDIIGIVHIAYQLPLSRKKITQGIKSLFISYRLQQAKIQSCVFIEYALSQHQAIRQKEIRQATVNQQKQQFGTIPQSILGFSSIQTQNNKNLSINEPNTNKQVSMNQPVGNMSNNNTSQYISNFQSVIHDENGLHRKVKSSQVSLQGFKVIDHKFHSSHNQYDKSGITNLKYSNIGPQNNKSVNIGNSKNQKMGSSKHHRTYQSQIQQQPKIMIRNTIKQTSQQRGTPNNKSSAIYNNKKISERDELGTVNKSPLQYSDEKNDKSPSYSQKFKSPDMSYELTPGTNSKYRSPNINRNILQNKSNKNTPYNIQATKTIKTQQMNDNDNNDDPLDQQSLKKKQGGYQMWKKLNQRNQHFIAKMLSQHRKAHDVTININQQEPNQNSNQKSQFQSINIIQDSIVRHFGVDKRMSNNMSKNQ